MGNYTLDKGLQLAFDFSGKSTLGRRMNLQEIKLRIMTVITQKIHEPFESYLMHNYDSYLDSLNRFNFILLNHVREMFNFTLE